MEPSFPSSSNPQNPNPTPNLNPSYSDLPSTVFLLRDLAALAESTLQSVSDFLSSSPSSSAAGLRPCPFDSRHRMPPESLFRHSLLCPSAPGAPLLDLGFLSILRYPSSLKSEFQLRKENPFVRPLPESDADLCFSLDGELGNIGTNFFYKDCPGVVTTPEPDSSSRTFTLPAILSTECANFISENSGGNGCLEEEKIRVLPSEFWALRCEVDAWRDYPVSYSYSVLRIASSLHGLEECGLKRWVISASPQFGILIDAAMRDHIFLLLKLCLKVIRREALCSLKFLISENRSMDVRSLSSECPRLVGSLTWFASQLSVLYGDANAKFFVIGMLKESLIRAGSCLMLFKAGEEKFRENDCGNTICAGINCEGCELSQSESTGDLEPEKPSEDCSSGQVFVTQVAAAVAALHERFLLEERIKVLRFGQRPSKPQLINEYISATTRACELRGKRPNYRPVLEHDGLHWQRLNNQDSGKVKTREELLAEERDYKRRRMSYRGKKVKRNPIQVLRDIIEDHMEEIKQAGGIGCNVKAIAEAVGFQFEQNSQSGTIADIHETRSRGYEASETKSDSLQYRKPQHAQHDVTFRAHRDISSNDRASMIHDLENPYQKLRYDHTVHREDGRKSKHEREKNYASRSPPIQRNHTHSRERYSHYKEQDDVEAAHKAKYRRRSPGNSPRYKDRISRSTLTTKSAREISKDYNYISESRSTNRGRSSESGVFESVTQDAFEDRYDPSSSYDGYSSSYDEDSVVCDNLISDKYHCSTNGSKYHYEQHGRDHATKRHNRDHYKK